MMELDKILWSALIVSFVISTCGLMIVLLRCTNKKKAVKVAFVVLVLILLFAIVSLVYFK